MGTVQCVNLCFMSCCVILHDRSWNENLKKKNPPPSLRFSSAATGSTGMFPGRRRQQHAGIRNELCVVVIVLRADASTPVGEEIVERSRRVVR